MVQTRRLLTNRIWNINAFYRKFTSLRTKSFAKGFFCGPIGTGGKTRKLSLQLMKNEKKKKKKGFAKGKLNKRGGKKGNLVRWWRPAQDVEPRRPTRAGPDEDGEEAEVAR